MHNPVPSVSVVTITPDQAKALLQLNTANRKIRERKVEEYAAAMTEGRWIINGSSVVLNGSTLVDGQHRLLACIKAGIPFETLLVAGVGDDAMPTIDTGMPRLAVDVLRIAGVAGDATIASTARLLLRWRDGSIHAPGRSRIVAHHQALLSFVNENSQRLAECVSTGKKMHSALRANPTAWAGFLFEVSEIFDPGMIEEFVNGTLNGVGLDDGDPRLALRNWAASQRKAWSEEWLSAIIRAWNPWASGKKIRIIRPWVRGQPFPEISRPKP